MPRISEISFISYVSRRISREMAASYILGLECNDEGTLILKLEPGHNLTQIGPVVVPPIRWLESFERNACFEIVCKIKNEAVSYLPGKRLSGEQQIKKEHDIFLGVNSENP